MDLSRWTGIVEADEKTGLVTVRSGTRLRDLNEALARRGLAMSNLGDIDAQTVAGAISTGTHGTGAAFGGIATQVRGLELVLADGSVVSATPAENPEVFAAARVGLGALGVLSTVTLQCERAYYLQADNGPRPLGEVLEGLDGLVEDNDHFEFYWFPHTSGTLVKRNNRMPAGGTPRPPHAVRSYVENELVENTLFGLLCRTCRRFPRLVPPLNRLSTRVLSTQSYSNSSHRVFVTPRAVRFVEMEYAVPRESVGAVLGEVRALVERENIPVPFPVEVRFAAADDIWLSTAFERDSAYLAVHQFVGMPYERYFRGVEAIMTAAGGRPHWGKLHFLGSGELRERYPRFDDFVALRERLDPDGLFHNAYLDRVLGAPGVPVAGPASGGDA